MPPLSRIASLWRNLFSRTRVERDLDDELRAHAALLAAERIARGMDPEQARREALVEIGGMEQVKEEVRDSRVGIFLETTLQDARYGLRMMARSPGFTIAAVIALAVGIGANTAIFSVVNAVLLRPLPYKDPDRLVTLLHHGNDPVAVANYLDWKAQSESFESMGAADYWTPNLTGRDRPEHLWGLKLTANMFSLLGTPPLIGRTFAPDEDQPGKEHEVVVGYGFWQRRLAGDPKAVGQTLTLDGEAYTIIGVMPPSFKFAPFWATRAELWVPNVLADRVTNRGGNSLRIFARLKPGVSLEQARAEIAAITARLQQQYPGTNGDVRVVSLTEKVVGDVRPALLVLLGAVAFVLLIACANVAHMLLARASARRKEIAVRSALGARRSRMVRQFLTESLVLALLGGAAGLLLARWGNRILIALAAESIPRLTNIGVDWRVLAFTLAISTLTGIAFGLAPALHAMSLNLNESLGEGGRGSSEGIRRNRVRSALVASEFALALMLLIGAGLMIRSLRALQALDPGFNPQGLVTMIVSVAGTVESPRRTAYYQEVLQRIRATPGVDSASAINHLPLLGDLWGWPYWVEGRPTPKPGEGLSAAYRVVLPGYFHTMQIPILRGRDINDSDNMNLPGVVVINQQFADDCWPGENPVGKRISMRHPNEGPVWLTVVGVVKNAKQEDWAEKPWRELYLPYLQTKTYQESPRANYAYMTLVVRTYGDPAAMVPSIKNQVWSVDKNVPISEVFTMRTAVSMANAQPRFYLVLLSTFAAIALLLAAVGIYGVMSYSIARRTHEIGIRMALGARQGDVLRMVISHGMVLALAGAVVGLAGALAVTRVMSSILYGVRPNDPATFAAVALVLCAVALVANFIPARRAMRVDPMVALRHE